MPSEPDKGNHDEKTPWPRYSVRSLLILTAFFAAVCAIIPLSAKDDLAALLVSALFLVAAGFAAGRSTRVFGQGNPRILWPIVVALIMLNCSLWLVNRQSLLVASESDIMQNHIIDGMIEFGSRRGFDVMAIAFAGLIFFTGWKGNQRLLCAAGTVCVLIWLIIVCMGYLWACWDLVYRGSLAAL